MANATLRDGRSGRRAPDRRPALSRRAGIGCAIGGHVVARSLQSDPAVQISENHPSWRGMYYLMLVLQGGLAVAYMI